MKYIDNDGTRTANRMNEVQSRLAQASRRLSSGYRVNSAADDAAGLAISEKLRAIDRGLRQGQRNINDGISYLDTVDGCAQELHDMLHRMKELAVEAANGTLSRVDREALDLEYQQLIEEIGQITDSAEFNGVPLFEKHYPEYELDAGSISHEELITIDGSNSPLIIGVSKDGASYECSVDIPAGTYTVDELADRIDDILWEQDPSLIIGVNENSQLTMQCEGGKIDYIGGNGASLFYDKVIGNSNGYLLGVTHFVTPDSKLEIKTGKNDVIEFRLGNTDDTKYSIRLDPGEYNRDQLIAHMNEKFQNAGLPCGMAAVAETVDGRNVIGIRSDLTMTGLSGNFLMIDNISSPIYDICKYSDRVNSEAVLSGTRRIPAGMEIECGRNDYFVLDAGWYDSGGNPHQEKLRIDLLDPGEDLCTYSSADAIADRIREKLAEYDCPVEVETVNGALKLTTLQYGKECRVKLDKTDVPSGYMVYDLFDDASLSVLKPGQERSNYTPASLRSNKKLGDSIVVPQFRNIFAFNITTDPAGSLAGGELVFDIPVGIYSRSQLQTKLNDMLATNYPQLKDKLYFSIGDTLSICANGAEGWEITGISAYDSSTYSPANPLLIAGANYYDNIDGSIPSDQEQTLISYTDTDPSTGRSTVSRTAGSTTPGVEYKDATIYTSSQQSDKLLSYGNASPSNTTGTTYKDPGYESIVDEKHTHYTPAYSRLNNVLTQFTETGTSQRDITLSFDLTDKDGKKGSYTVSIPKGSTAAQAVEKINKELSGVVEASANGSDLVLESEAEGANVQFSNLFGNMMQYAKKSSLASRSGAVIDGDTVYVPSTLTLSKASSNIPLTVDGTNDRLAFTLGGKSYDLRLENRTYSSLSDLAAEINAKMSAANGGSAAGVRASGDSLVFTGAPKDAGGSSFSASSTCPLNKQKVTNNVADSPYYDPATGNAETPAKITLSSVDSHLPLTIDSTNNSITMDYTRPDPSSPSGSVTETLTITIPDGTYTSGENLASAINSAIAADPSLNGKISASYSPSGSDKGLTFTSSQRGSGCSLSNLNTSSNINKYKKTNSTPGGTPDPGENKLKFPAYIRNTKFSTLFDDYYGLQINDLNDTVSINVNGTQYKFKLAHGIYWDSTDGERIVDQIRDGLNGSGVTVELNGSEIRLTTSNVGAGASISLNADNTSPIFKRAETCGKPSATDRRYSPAYLIGRATVDNIEIKDYYGEMTFDYSYNGLSQTLTVSVPEGNYTADTLAAAIQDSIDGQIGKGQLEVGVSSGRLTITAKVTGGDQSMKNFSGRLFNRVFQDVNYTGVNQHTEKVGTTTGAAISYIIGRNTMEPETEDELKSGKNVIIYTGLNDELKFDFTYQGHTYEVGFTIPGGTYDPGEIADAVQAAGREAMSKMKDVNGDPLPADRFYATIGLSGIGVTGISDTGIDDSDKLILSYIVPDNGTVKQADAIIDGVRGSSAYRLFYDATQSPKPSRIIGKADLSNGVSIIEGQNDQLCFELDGVPIRVKIPAGLYDSRTISDVLNKKLEAIPCLVRTVDYNGNLMFFTTENGAFELDKFTGSASDDLFYGADKRDDDTEIGIHYGRRTDSYIWYNKTRTDEHLMRINTTGVTTVSRALKAIDRLNYANDYLSGWRAVSGAQRNRSEHAYSYVTSTIENINSAEQGIRDADIAREVNAAAKQKLVMQAQGYIMSKQKENSQSILNIMA